MSTTLKGVALGLAVPLALTMSGWAGWTALTSNLAPAESTRTDQAKVQIEVEAEPVFVERQPEMAMAAPRLEPSQTASPAPEVSDAVEPVQRSATGTKSTAEVAPTSVAKSALAPVTAIPVEPTGPKKPKIRYVRVPKATADPARN